MALTNSHQTTVVPHDHVHCHTARHAEGGDCGTRYEVRCSCGWAQGASSRAVADAIAVGHRGYSPDAAVIVTSDIPQMLRFAPLPPGVVYQQTLDADGVGPDIGPEVLRALLEPDRSK